MSEKACKEGLQSHSDDQNGGVLGTIRESFSSNPHSLDNEAKRTMENTQKVIKSLLKIVMCGKQGLALHGHRDDAIDWEDEENSSNDSNFVQLVRFRAETDPRVSLLVTFPNHQKMFATHLKPFKINWCL